MVISKSYLNLISQSRSNAWRMQLKYLEVRRSKLQKKEKKLEAAIGSEGFKASYLKLLVDNWIDQLKVLSKLLSLNHNQFIQPLFGGFKGKLTYCMRTVPYIKDYLMPLEEVIRFKFIPSITGGHICSNGKRVLLSLQTRFGGLANPLFHENAGIEFENSRKLTS